MRLVLHVHFVGLFPLCGLQATASLGEGEVRRQRESPATAAAGTTVIAAIAAAVGCPLPQQRLHGPLDEGADLRPRHQRVQLRLPEAGEDLLLEPLEVNPLGGKVRWAPATVAVRRACHCARVCCCVCACVCGPQHPALHGVQEGIKGQERRLGAGALHPPAVPAAAVPIEIPVVPLVPLHCVPEPATAAHEQLRRNRVGLPVAGHPVAQTDRLAGARATQQKHRAHGQVDLALALAQTQGQLLPTAAATVVAAAAVAVRLCLRL
mmetsp:Transcript_35190/g.78192  ORF Transcript_35190/g.78192 Transcript_35190/m.78192 type:complete len:265 (-) Transcript_35190:197-991(-)